MVSVYKFQNIFKPQMGKNRTCKACCESGQESEPYYRVQKTNQKLMQLIQNNPNFASYYTGASSKQRGARNMTELLKTQEALLWHLEQEIIKERDRFAQERCDLMYITAIK